MTDYIDQIEDYLDDALAEAEKTAFEEALLHNTDLQEALLIHKQLRQTIRKHQQAAETVPQLEAILKAQSLSQRKPAVAVENRRTFKLRNWIVTGSLAACMIVIVWVSGLFGPEDYMNLPEMPRYETRGGASPDELYLSAAEAYNQQDYPAAIRILEDLADPGYRFYNSARYYLGLSYLGNLQYQEAVSSLKELADGESAFRDEASYFLGLSYSRINNKHEALVYLSKVPSGNIYYGKAQKLIKEIR